MAGGESEEAEEDDEFHVSLGAMGAGEIELREGDEMKKSDPFDAGDMWAVHGEMFEIESTSEVDGKVYVRFVGGRSVAASELLNGPGWIYVGRERPMSSAMLLVERLHARVHRHDEVVVQNVYLDPPEMSGP